MLRSLQDRRNTRKLAKSYLEKVWYKSQAQIHFLGVGANRLRRVSRLGFRNQCKKFSKEHQISNKEIFVSWSSESFRNDHSCHLVGFPQLTQSRTRWCRVVFGRLFKKFTQNLSSMSIPLCPIQMKMAIYTLEQFKQVHFNLSVFLHFMNVCLTCSTIASSSCRTCFLFVVKYWMFSAFWTEDSCGFGNLREKSGRQSDDLLTW